MFKIVQNSKSKEQKTHGRAKYPTSLYKLTMTGRQTDGQKKRFIGAQAFALPKNTL